MKVSSAALVGLVALAAAVGCSPASGSPRESGTAPAVATPSMSAMPTAVATAAPSTVITYAAGPGDLVLRAASGGGLLPMERRLAEMPTISIYGDGRVIRVVEARAGPTDPLMPELVESRVTPDGLGLVLAAAGEAGLLGPDRRLGLEGVYDLWTVTFTITANGATHHAWVYALGFPEEAKLAPPDEMPARQALSALFAHLQDLGGWLGSGRVGPEAAHRPASLRVYVAPAIAWPTEAGGTPGPATPRVGQDVREWPLDPSPEAFGAVVDRNEGSWRCGLLEADAVERLGLDTATNDTRWRAGHGLYRVVVRPLLPDEAGCFG